MQESICYEPDCTKEIEEILWSEDTILKCKDHGISSENSTYAPVNEMNFDHFHRFILLTKEIIARDLQQSSNSLKNELGSKIKNLKDQMEELKQKIIVSEEELAKIDYYFKDINDLCIASIQAISYINWYDLSDCKSALYQLNYLKKTINSKSIKNLLSLSQCYHDLKELQKYFISKKTFCQNKNINESIYYMASKNEKLENKASSFNIISLENYGNAQIERWKLTNEKGKVQTMKFIRNATDESKKIIQNEINFITQFKSFFTSILQFEEQGLIGYYSIYIEPLKSQLNSTFNIHEVQKFLYFFRDFMNSSVVYIEAAYIDPSIIGYDTYQFYILDFKYISSAYDKNYSAPEVLINEKIRPSSSFIYSCGLIAIEMLGQKVAGFNNSSAIELINIKIRSLEINDELKRLLERMVHPDRSHRINRAEFNKILNSPTLFS